MLIFVDFFVVAFKHKNHLTLNFWEWIWDTSPTEKKQKGGELGLIPNRQMPLGVWRESYRYTSGLQETVKPSATGKTIMPPSMIGAQPTSILGTNRLDFMCEPRASSHSYSQGFKDGLVVVETACHPHFRAASAQTLKKLEQRIAFWKGS